MQDCSGKPLVQTHRGFPSDFPEKRETISAHRGALRRVKIHAVRYRALGPITVELDGHIAKLGGLRQQMVLAVLLRSANRVVSQDSLIDSVWAGEPPEAARATVQSYIYNLRRALGPDAILRRGDGYLIEVDAGTFDVLAFEESVKTGTELLKGEPASARATLVGGLDLWFGNAYGGVDHSVVRRVYGSLRLLFRFRLPVR